MKLIKEVKELREQVVAAHKGGGMLTAATQKKVDKLKKTIDEKEKEIAGLMKKAGLGG